MQKHGVVLKMRGEKGFSIIEVLIAIVLFAIGILAIGKMQLTSISGNSFAFGLTEGVTIAQEKLEQLVAMDFNNSNLTDTDGDGTNQDSNGDGVDDDGGNFGLNDDGTSGTPDHNESNGRYSVFWNVAVDEPIQDTKTVRVIVIWNQKGSPKRVAVETVISNNN